MNPAMLFAGVVLVLAGAFGPTRPSGIERAAGETDAAFVGRALQLPPSADAHVTAANWNGVATLFVDHQTVAEYPERIVTALQRQPTGGYRAIEVTVGEQEGGTPDIAAIGFANADRDPAKELIVILAWPQQHYDVEGTLYEVRLFDDPKPGRSALTPLRLSHRFGAGCDCGRRDGTSSHFRFKTVAAVKAALRRLGY